MRIMNKEHWRLLTKTKECMFHIEAAVEALKKIHLNSFNADTTGREIEKIKHKMSLLEAQLTILKLRWEELEEKIETGLEDTITLEAASWE